jgi:serine/threonine-protein kinase HipA
LLAQNLGLSANNDVALLDKLGGDCAGAVSFVPEGQLPVDAPPSFTRLDDLVLAEILRDRLPLRPLLAGDGAMRLSLAGAQSKWAVCIENDAVVMPQGTAMSTHILKPGNPRFENLVFNEAFCMTLAGKLGLSVAQVQIQAAHQVPYLLISRYDRKVMPGLYCKRLHQEDFCQAMGIPPELKYQKEGGPSLKSCFDLVRRYSSVPAQDLFSLLDTVVFNVLIGNNDAHGKNFSFLYDGESVFDQNVFEPQSLETKPTLKIGLAPRYDLVSTMVYPHLSSELAMSIGGEYDAQKIRLSHFEKLADETGLSRKAVRQRVITFAQQMLDVVESMTFEYPGVAAIQDLVRHRVGRVLSGE